jgi:hypothetical protein
MCWCPSGTKPFRKLNARRSAELRADAYQRLGNGNAARLGVTIGGARMGEDLIDTVRETIKFLRKLTAELRRIADGADPGAVQQLRRTANQCEAQANDVAERFGIGP